jgi:hypothetical protein
VVGIGEVLLLLPLYRALVLLLIVRSDREWPLLSLWELASPSLLLPSELALLSDRGEPLLLLLQLASPPPLLLSDLARSLGCSCSCSFATSPWRRRRLAAGELEPEDDDGDDDGCALGPGCALAGDDCDDGAAFSRCSSVLSMLLTAV